MCFVAWERTSHCSTNERGRRAVAAMACGPPCWDWTSTANRPPTGRRDPVLAVAMAPLGESRVGDASELRVKESDRIETTLGVLKSMGVRTHEQPDGFSVWGMDSDEMNPPAVDAGLDHRIVMATLVAGLPLSGETEVVGADAINSSFPNFMDLVDQLRA